MSENRVHIYARHIKRAFTFEEWCDYLKEHPDSRDEVVFSDDGYDWNIYCVCRNPKCALSMECGSMKLTVKVAKAAGMWVSGCDYALRECGGGGPVSYVGPNIDAFTTEREAIIYELERMIERIESEIDSAKRRGMSVANLLKFKLLITQELGKLVQVQLSLF